MNEKALLNKRKRVSKRMPGIKETVRGSVVIMERTCGKSGCRCRKGFKHKAVYLSQNRKGKTRMVYIPGRNTEKLRRYIRNYRKAKALLNAISDVNIELLTKK